MLAEMLSDMVREPAYAGVYADWLEDAGGRGASRWRGWADRLDSLSDEQAALLPAWRDYWLEVGLRADPAALVAAPPAAELRAALAGVYREGGLPPPAILITLRSPLEGCVGAYLLAQVWDQVRTQVRTQVWDQVRTQVRAQVGDQVGVQVRDQVGDQVGDQVRDQVGDQVGDQVYKCGYGSHDAAWLSFYSYLLVVGRVRCCERLLPLMRLAHLCGWWWPFQGAAIVTPRPSLLSMRQGRLAEVCYPDGWGITRGAGS
jgi:hypothetical protein